jgi:hypothetical protein
VVNGNAKGAKFENRICRAISQWLVDGDWTKCRIDELPFRRRFTASPSLEGFWVRGGDLLHRTTVKSPFSIECKNIEGWVLDGAYSAKKWEPWGWWEQCRDQAQTVGLVPLLIFTRNRYPVYVLMTKETEEWLQVRPRSGPVARLERPSGEALALVLLDDLARVPRSRALRTSVSLLANAG